MPKIIAIAGGSGSGKSTLAASLYKKNPELFAVVHLDDYFRHSDDAPRKGTHINWDDPRSLDFEKLRTGLESLLRGESITVFTKSELYYPEYDPQDPKRINYTIESKPIILVEGYLILYCAEIRELVDFSIYLDMPIEESLQRRSKNKAIQTQEYFNEVLYPAHREFVEPTKSDADLVIDVSGMTAEEVTKKVYEIIVPTNGFPSR